MISSSKLISTLTFLVMLNFSGCGSKVENLLSRYENAIEKWEKISEKKICTSEEMIEINKENLKLIKAAQKIKDEEWNRFQREKFFKLSERFSEISEIISLKAVNKY